ncbi:hypothetical protein THRCLA_00775 [Thraustotheca clavata]|uniref:BZIP domain-containing protein n=1 Tax=Thraustotheca clavata TaxID=74557 RepID=A0A1W0AAK4_9STRA|nr:hypothetical protein THRCLA_00775 [Thraustotheca clavata]
MSELCYLTDSLPTAQMTAKERTEQRRYECMINQRRYRARKKAQHEEKMKTIAETKREIDRFEQLVLILKNRQVSRHINAGSYRHQSISVYVNMFHHGLARNDQSKYDTQLNLLGSIMRQSLIFNGEIGIPSLVKQWRIGASLFPYIEMQTLELQVHGSDQSIVSVIGTMKATITRTTIQALFPHVFKREDIVQKLIAEGLFSELRMSFFFDDDQVTIMESEINFMGGLYKALGDLEEMSYVVHAEGGSKMLSDGTIVYEGPAPTEETTNKVAMDYILS